MNPICEKPKQIQYQSTSNFFKSIKSK